MTDRTHARAPSARPSESIERLEDRRLLSGATGGGTPLGPPETIPNNGLPTVNLTYDLSSRYQTWDGTGAAMNTWKYGGSYDDPQFYNDLVGDAGVNIVRVPLWQGLENVNDNDDPNVLNLSGFSSQSLAPAMRFVQEFKKRSPDVEVLASVWTPPYWMKTNGAQNEGGTLRADMYEEFAEYLTAYVKLAQRDYGVQIDVLSLQNEPFFIEWYESAVYTPGQMLKLMKTVKSRFDSEGITTRLIAPEDLNFYDRFRWWADAITGDPEVADTDFVWGTHFIPPNTLPDVQNTVRTSGKPLWLTESGGANTNDWRAALHLGDTITHLMNDGDLSAFLDWQFDGDGHSSLYQNDAKAPRYYALKHFAHWIRPGAQRVGLSASNADFDGDNYQDVHATAWYDPARNAETLVMTNTHGAIAGRVHVSGVAGGAAAWHAWVSDPSAKFADAPITPDATGNGFTVTVPAFGIVTLYNGTSDPVQWTPANTGRGSPQYVQAIDPTFLNPLNQAALEGSYYGVTNHVVGTNYLTDFSNGRNALFLAAASPRSESVQVESWLIDHGADPNDLDVDGITPTMVAASNPWIDYSYNQNLSVLKLRNLVDRGGSLTAKDFKGRTALHWAATTAQYDYGESKAQDPRVVQYLLSAGADKNKVDRSGKRPADWAAEMGNTANRTVINAWTGDTAAPELLDRTYDLDRQLMVAFNFDEAMAGLTAAQLKNAVRLHLLNANGGIAASVPFAGTTSTLPAGNTRLEVMPSPYTLPDGYLRLDAEAGTGAALRDVAGNAFQGALGSFWFLNGDADGDKHVGTSDFLIVRQNFGKRGVGFAGGDFDFDGVVGNSDFSILRRQMGKSLGPAPAGFGDAPLPGTPPTGTTPVVSGRPGSSPPADMRLPYSASPFAASLIAFPDGGKGDDSLDQLR